MKGLQNAPSCITVLMLVTLSSMTAQAAELSGWVATNCVHYDEHIHRWVGDMAVPCRNGQAVAVDIDILADHPGEVVRVMWILRSVSRNPINDSNKPFLVARERYVFLAAGHNYMYHLFQDVTMRQADSLQAIVVVRSYRGRHRSVMRGNH